MKHRPKKQWGQNFLRNPSAVERIVGAIGPQPGEIILEIGPGEGALTEKLLALGNPVRAIEIDPDLTASLEERFGERLQIIHGDATEVPLPEQPFRAVGNLPYNVGTPILRRVIASPHCRRAVFMLQKEVANRTVARPGDEDYGFLSLYVQIFAEARTLMTLNPGSFYPAPKVRSAVVVFDLRPPTTANEPQSLIELISASFRMRRKKLVNNLGGYTGLSRDAIQRAMENAKIGLDARAEEMPLEAFDGLASAIARGGDARNSED